MIYHGYVQNGRVELDERIRLPEGAEVQLIIVGDETRCFESAAAAAKRSEPSKPIEEVIADIVADVPEAEWEKLPSDLSEQLDHYVYGLPKR
jgi:hypothetical protein